MTQGGNGPSLENQLLEFLYASPTGLLEFSADGTIGLINPTAMQLIMTANQATDGSNFFSAMEHCAPDLRNLANRFPRENGTVCGGHRIFIRPARGGEDAHVLSCTMVKLNANRFVVNLEDVSTHVAQEMRLRQAETWFGSLIDDVNDFAVIALDAAGKIERMNPSAERQTGFSQIDAVGQSLAMLRPTNAPSLLLEAAKRNGWALEEGWLKCATGSAYWCQTLLAVRSESDEGVSGYTAVLRKVTRKDTSAETLRLRLTTDHLTGAYNRAYFFEKGEAEWAQARRHGQALSVIVMDVDFFKRVNDTHGHPAGDAALAGITQACGNRLRQKDIMARVGGEEFCILLPSTDLAGAMDLAERLRAAVAACEIVHGVACFFCTASFGCATASANVPTLGSLLAQADAALYAAKSGGRNRVVSVSQADCSVQFQSINSSILCGG